MLRVTSNYLWLAVFLLLAWLTPVWADHGAPAPQLGGVILCLEPSSVQLEAEGINLSQAVSQKMYKEVFSVLQTQLETQNVSYTASCTTSSSYVLLTLYVRFLDPQTYIGFAENSYTYVTTAQVGGFVADADAETVLPESIYSASASDIFQAGPSEKLEQRVAMLGEVEAKALVQMWLEANAVTLGGYLLFAALGVSLIALRVLTALLR